MDDHLGRPWGSAAEDGDYPRAWIQTCIVHQIRACLRYVPDKHRKAVPRELRPIYTAVNAEAASGPSTASRSAGASATR